MAFDENTWKEKIRERLKGWKGRMEAAGVNSIYAFLSASALLPVIQQASQGGEWPVISTAISAFFAGIGGNLLANRVQDWRDESDLAREIEMKIEQDPKLREELDVLIEKMDVLAEAKNHLPEIDRKWFATTVHRELKALGNLSRFQATLDGTGSIVQGNDNVTSGAGGVSVKGNVYGNITIGSSDRQREDES